MKQYDSCVAIEAKTFLERRRNCVVEIATQTMMKFGMCCPAFTVTDKPLEGCLIFFFS